MPKLVKTTHSILLPIILASGSPYRKIQMQQLQLPIKSIPAHIDETPRPGEAADSLALRLAQTKAQSVARDNPTAIIVGCDQTASCEKRLLGKPGTSAKAEEQLTWCSGKSVYFYSALCAYNAVNKTILADIVTTEVKFRPLSQAQISNYVRREQPLDCAGSFKCEGLGIVLFEHIRSDDPSALIGLPLIRLTDFLANFGVHPV